MRRLPLGRRKALTTGFLPYSDERREGCTAGSNGDLGGKRDRVSPTGISGQGNDDSDDPVWPAAINAREMEVGADRSINPDGVVVWGPLVRIAQCIGAIVLLCGLAVGQGSRNDFAALSNTGVPIAFPSVRICQLTASGVPCSPLATIFTDQTLTSQAANPFTGDAYGNAFFYGAPGWYQVQVSGAGVSPYTFKVLLGPDVNNVAVLNFGTLASLSNNPSQTGNVKLGPNDQVCWRNNANTADVCLAKNGSDQLIGITVTTTLATSVVSPNLNPASGGIIKFSNGDTSCWRNNANTGDDCLGVNSADFINVVSGSGLESPDFMTSTALPAQSGEVRLATGDLVCWRNTTNTADVCISMNASNQLIGVTASATAPFTTGSTNPAASGVLRLSSGDTACWRNTGNSADVCLSENSNNQIVGVTTLGKYTFTAASCNNASPAAGLDLPTSAAPAPNCNGSNVRFGELDYSHSNVGYLHFRLPSTWVGNVDVAFKWFAADNTAGHNTTWTIASGCETDGTTVMTSGPSLNTANSVTTSDNATASTMTLSTISAITMTGCSAGQSVWFQIGRGSSDTNTGTAALVEVEFTVRQTTQ